MKETFRLMWVVSLFASLIFAFSGAPSGMMWFANGFMWASLIAMLIASDEKIK